MININDHGRSKYLRDIHDVKEQRSIVVDVYCVLESFNVTCPARAHAIKKLLCTGIRGKGDSLQDLRETVTALERAIKLEEQRIEVSKQGGMEVPPPEDRGEISDNPGMDVTGLETMPVERMGLAFVGWRVYMVMDERGVNPVGFRVGWPCEGKRTFLVAHYISGENGDPSLPWCKNAAERHASRLNNEGKRPEEFAAWGCTNFDIEVKETKDVVRSESSS